MAKAIDITNQRFGRLVAIRPVSRDTHNKKILWLCRCACGRFTTVPTGALRRNRIRSCKHHTNGYNNPNYRHGFANTHPLYAIWSAIRQRCNNPNHPRYKDYGGSGIQVDPRWEDFSVFLAEVGERPHSSLTLDRYPNPNGNYELGNIRWATTHEQNNNKRARRLDQFTTAELEAELARRQR